jgi:hypothetical protein
MLKNTLLIKTKITHVSLPTLHKKPEYQFRDFRI